MELLPGRAEWLIISRVQVYPLLFVTVTLAQHARQGTFSSKLGLLIKHILEMEIHR